MDEERWKFISEHTAWKTHASQSLAKELYAYCEKLRAENFELKRASADVQVRRCPRCGRPRLMQIRQRVACHWCGFTDAFL